MTDCIFCQIVARTAPATITYEDDHVVAFNALNPVAPLHMLVVPKRHVASLSDADTDVAGRVAVASANVALTAGYANVAIGS